MNNITIDTIRTYVKELEQKGYSNELIVRKLHATLDFLRWAYHKDFMKYSQFQQLKDEIANFKVKFEASDFHKAENTTPYASIDEDQEKSSVLRSIRSRIPFLNPHHKDSEKKTEGTSSELQNSSLSPRYYIGMAFVVLIIGILGSGIYERFFSTTSKIFAYPSSPSAAARILSFQGRLTDSLGNPITAATNMRFRLYTASSGGTTLYDSGTCSITPDQDGVHNVLIGSECGSEVASSVFTENTQVWLGVTVGSDSEMTPRQRIANVPYAINAETLQGLPVGTEVSNIPYINAGGDLLMAASSPQIGSTYTNQDFLISSARAITIQSAGSGDVTLTATESGTIKFATGGSQHGIITNGGLFGFGTTGPDAKLDVLYTGGEQLRLTYADGSTYTGFTTNSSGDLTIDPSGGDVFLANNDILNIGGSGTDTAYNAIADSVAGASANVNSDNDLYIEGNLEVDGTIYGNVSGTISPGFTQGSIVFADGSGNLAQDNASLYFDDTNNKVGIGTAAPVGKFHVTGAATGKALSIFNETGDQNIITASASGTTVANLDRSGNLAIEGAISDLGGTTLAVNDNLDVSGTLFSGTADAFQVDASGNITTTGDLAVNGDDITGDSNLTINAAGYVRVGDTASPGSANGDDDLFVEGDLEVDGTGYFDGIITQAGGDGSSYAGAVTFNDDVDFTLLGTENVSITNTISGNQSVDLLSVTLTDQTSSAVQRGVVVTKADTTDATTDSLLTIDNAETTANLLTDYLIITKASTGPDTTTDAIDVSDADLGNAINVGANTVVGTTADLDFSNFDVTGSTGNITTAGDIAINGGDITSTSTAFKFDIGNTGTLTFRDGTNNLVAIKDQGVYAFLNLSAKTDTGDPASCAEGDIYYNDADDTIKICHESNTWEALDGGAVASQWTDSGTTVYLTDTTDEVVIGGSSPLSSAKFSIDGDADQIQLIVQGNGTQTSNLATFEQSDGTDVLTITNAGNLTTAGDLAVNGDDITGDSNLTINAASYVRVGDTASPGSANGDDDLFVEGDLEIDGVLYTDGGIDTTLTAGSVVFAGTSGVLTQDNANFFWDDTNNKLGLGTTAPDAKFQVTGAATGKALVILNETGDQDIIAASASGVTRFRVGNDGTVYGGYFADISNTSYGIDPAGTSNFGGYSLKITGGALLAVDSGNVGIGDSTPDAKLNIQATTEQLRLDYDDSNYTSFTVSSGGDLTLAPTGSDTNITGDVDVSDQLAAGPNGAITTNEIVSIDYNTVPVDTTGTIGIDLNQTLTGSGTSSAVHYGIANTLNESSSSTGNVNHTNFYNYMSNNNASIGGNSTWRGAYTYLQNNAASGTIGLTDQYMATTQNASTGNITDARNYYSSMINSSTGTLSNIYNFWAASPTNASGTITTAYGLYVADQSVGTNTTAYGLYVANQSGSSGNAIGLYIADADDYSIQLASTDGDAASGITFGTDTNLYRNSANQLHTDDTFDIDGNLITDGNTTLGNASGDTVTANADAWTFANDTTVALSGGVNGINFDSNTLSIDATNNRIGIGTAAPSYQLQSSQTISAPSSATSNIYASITNNTASASLAEIAAITGLSSTSYSSGTDDNAYVGIKGLGQSAATGGTTVGVTGVRGLAQMGNVNTTTNLYGGRFGISHDYGTVTNAYGILLDHASLGSTTLTNRYGAYSQNPTGAGTITNNFGFYVAAQTAGGTQDVGIYVADADTYSLQLASTDGDAASGITFGTDTNLYRSAANTLKTDDDFFAVGNITTSGDLAVNGNDITSSSNLTLNATGYTRVGDTASPGSATGDDDLFVESDIELDGVLYLDGTIDTTFTAGSVVFAGTSGVLAQDNASFFFDDTNNRLGIGDTTPDAFVDITGTTAQLRLSYETGDTNYASFTVSSGGDLTIAPTGGDLALTGDVDISSQLALGDNASITSTDILTITDTSVDVTAGSNYGIDLNQTLTGGTTASGSFFGIASVLGDTSTATNTYSTRSYYGDLSLSNSSANGNSTRETYYGRIFNNSTGTVNSVVYNAETRNEPASSSLSSVGFKAILDNRSTGTVTNNYGFYADSPSNGSGTITTAYGAYIADQSVGTNTTAYGLYIANQSGSSGNAIGLYIADADDYSIQLASTDGDAASGITFGTDTNLYRSAANTLKTDDGLLVTGTTGIGTTGPDAKLDVLSTTEQLRLTYADGSTYSSFTVDSSGDLTIAPSGGDTKVTGTLAASSILQVGSATATTYSRFGTNSTGHSLSGAGSALISGDLEVDGTLYADGAITAVGTVTGGDFSCTDCLDFAEFEDTLDLDAALVLNQSTNTWTQNFTGTTGTTGYTYNADSLTTGTGILSSFDALTSGIGHSITSTSTALSSGNLLSLDWSPGSATTATGDLVKINIGTNGNVGNLLNVTDTSSSLFRVAESQIESAVPHAFTAPGDVSIAYDLLFSNQTASYIKSNAPLYVEAGETFESNNLTLRAYNSGDIILDLGSGNVVADGNILPTADDTYNLGSNTYRWADAFLGGETIHIGTSTSDEATLGYTTSSNLFNVTNSYGNIQLTSGTVVLSGTTTLTASSLTALNCSDCTDFDDLEDTLDLDAALTLNQSTNTWTQNFTGTTADGLTYNGNSLTSGNLMKLSTTSTSFTSGAFINADWSPGSTTTNSGDLLKINTGTNGNLTGNYINLLKASTTLFKVAGGTGNVTTEGDLAINGGDITSSAALNIDVNTNITTPDTLTVGSATAGVGKLNVTGAQTGKALTILNETGDQNVLVASVSGTQVFALTNNGDVVQGKNGGISGLADNESLAPNPSFEINADGVYPPDGWSDSVGTNTTTSTSNHGNTAILFDTDTDAIISNCFPIAGGKNLAQGLGTDRTYTVSLWSQLVNAIASNGLNAGIYTYTSRSNCTSNSTPTQRAAFTNSSPTIVWGYASGTVTPATGDTWARAYVIYDYTSNDADMRVDGVVVAQTNITSGLDLAETYPADPAENVQMGEIVSFGTEAQQHEADINNIKRSSGQYDKNAFGIVATQPGYVLDDNKSYNKVKVALKGRVPVLVTTENGPIKIGDPITASSKPGVGMKATRSGRIIGYAMTEWTSSDPNEIDQVTVFVNPETYVDLSILTSLQESVTKLPALTASALSRADDIVINTADALLITTEKLVAQSITSVNATIDNLVVDRIVSREIKAKAVNTETLEAQKITTDNLVAQDIEGKDASFSGKLVAQEIDADNIRELRQRLEKLSAEQADEPEFNSEQLQSEVENIQQYLNNMPDQATQTNLPINEITSNTSIDPGTSTSITGDVISLLNVEKLTVTGEAVMTSLVVADSFTAGNIFVKDNTILSLNNELKLSALENISLMDGAVMIAKNGTITAKGEVIAEKGVRTNTIKGLDTNNPIGVQLSQNKVEVLNNDNVVAAIDEKGSAKFKDVSVDTYTDATSSAAIIAAEDNYEENGILSPAIQTNAAAAGNGILPAKNDTVVIYNEKIGPKSLVYVTATSKTYNHNLYVAEKKSCTPEEKLEENCKPYFTVHIDGVVKDAISFNWSIVN